MIGRKEDVRIRRTKKLLLHSLTKLLEKKPLNKITVTELTDLADVSRATFYLYYKDARDMMRQVEDEMFNKFNLILEQYVNRKLSYDDLLTFNTYIFDFVKQYEDMCRFLLGPNSDYVFVEKFKKTIKDSYEKSDNEDISYISTFIISGYMGVIQQWLENNMKTPLEDMAYFIGDMNLSNRNKLSNFWNIQGFYDLKV